MDKFVFACCGGRHFILIPYLGFFEAKFVASATIFISLVSCLLYVFKKHFRKIIVGLVLVCGIVIQVAISTSGNENGVKGWMQALDMSKVDIQSDALRQWVQDQARTIASLNAKNNIQTNKNIKEQSSSSPKKYQLDNFDLSDYGIPKRVRVLNQNESLEAIRLLYEDKDSWIHMDRRAGPLPSFIYGTYYQYNSHGIDFPSPQQVKERFLDFKRNGDPGKPNFQRATSTISYTDKHGVQHYNYKQNQLFSTISLHEKFRKAISQAIGMPVKYHPHWGLPGVHITFSHKLFEHNVFQAHIDGSYSPIIQEFAGSSKTMCVPFHRLSITLTLQVII